MIKTIDTTEVTKEMTLAFHKIVSVNGLGVLYNFEDAVREMLEQAPAVESAFLNTCLSNAKQVPAQAVPYGWHVTGMSCLMVGEYAEHDAKAAAKRCGGTTKAIPLYTHPAPLDSDTRAMIWDVSHLAVLDQSVMTADERKKHINELAKICDKLRERLEAGA